MPHNLPLKSAYCKPEIAPRSRYRDPGLPSLTHTVDIASDGIECTPAGSRVDGGPTDEEIP